MKVLGIGKIEENGGSFNYELSTDNGTHYESVVPGQPHAFTYPGNILKVRINGTETAEPDASREDNTPILKAWAVIWNPDWFRRP